MIQGVDTQGKVKKKSAIQGFRDCDRNLKQPLKAVYSTRAKPPKGLK